MDGTVGWEAKPYPWIQRQLYVETNNVDIAFVGSSRIWAAIHTPYVRDQLSKRLNRPVEVFTLGWGGPGQDIVYFVARELLEHRRVHTLVIYDERSNHPNSPHGRSYPWLSMGLAGEITKNLPRADQLSLYAFAVENFPRNLLAAFRPDRPMNPTLWERAASRVRSPWETELAGAARHRTGYGNLSAAFRLFDPTMSRAKPSDVLLYGVATSNFFSFSRSNIPPLTVQFDFKLGELCREHGTQLIALHIPAPDEAGQATIPERQPFSEMMGVPVHLIGIPGLKLFAGFSPTEIRKLFYSDELHLNQNGEDLFTPLITETLLNLYATYTNHL